MIVAEEVIESNTLHFADSIVSSHVGRHLYLQAVEGESSLVHSTLNVQNRGVGIYCQHHILAFHNPRLTGRHIVREDNVRPICDSGGNDMKTQSTFDSFTGGNVFYERYL